LDLADEIPAGRIFLIPVKLENCLVPERLSKLQWVDLTTPGADERLLKALRAVAVERLEPGEIQSSEKNRSSREAPFSIANLSEPGGLKLDGFKVHQG
jgi:hypothetical protein